MAPITKSALKRGASTPKPKPKPKRQVFFGQRVRTFRVPSSDYHAKKPEHGYIMSGSQIPRRWPEKTEEEKAEAIRKAREVATDVAEDEDVAVACLSLLFYKYRQNSHYLNTYYIETCSDAQREDRTGDWRAPDSDSDDLDAALATIEPDPSV